MSGFSSLNNKDDEKNALNAQQEKEQQLLEQQSKDTRSSNYSLKQQLEQLRLQINNLERETNNTKGEIASLQQSEEKLKIEIRHRYDDKIAEAQKKMGRGS